MTNHIKRAELYNRQSASTSKIHSKYSSSSVSETVFKDEAHNMPDKSSGNEQRLLEHFYAKTHNLMASYHRLEDDENRQAYYTAHKAEVLAGGETLVKAINTILDEASSYDQQYGTFYNFLMMSQLHHNEASLRLIGIEINKFEHVFLIRRAFYVALLERPSAFEFLFEPRNGLIDRLDQLYFKIASDQSSHVESQGQIIDLKG